MDRDGGEIASVLRPDDTVVDCLGVVTILPSHQSRELRDQSTAVYEHRFHLRAVDDQVTNVAPVALHHAAEVLLLILDRYYVSGSIVVVAFVELTAELESAEGIVLRFFRDLAACQSKIVAAVMVLAALVVADVLGEDVECFGTEDVFVDSVAELSWQV